MRSPTAVLASLLTLALAAAGCGAGTAEDGDAGAPTPTVAGTSAPDETQQAASPASFTFAAAGDLGARRATARSLALLDRSPAEFFLALGDLAYDDVASERAWCDYVVDRLPAKGSAFPFQLLVGNHEQDAARDGHIDTYADCLPDRLGVDGRYAAQYAFNYPADAPLARFVLVSPGMRVDGHRYDYSRGTADRAWLREQLRQARDAGQWLVVGMHLPCLTTGADHPGCDSGRAVLNLVLRGGADLLVVGHNHVYERSKQLRLSAGCPSVRPRYGSSCITDGGRDGVYQRDRGTVQVTAGRFGARFARLADRDPDRRWFVKRANRTAGFLQVEVTADRLVARYRASVGSFRDRFVIE